MTLQDNVSKPLEEFLIISKQGLKYWTQSLWSLGTWRASFVTDIELLSCSFKLQFRFQIWTMYWQCVKSVYVMIRNAKVSHIWNINCTKIILNRRSPPVHYSVFINIQFSQLLQRCLGFTEPITSKTLKIPYCGFLGLGNFSGWCEFL